MLEHPEENVRALELLKEAVRETAGDDEAAAAFQRKLVAPVAAAGNPAACVWRSTRTSAP